MQHFLCHGRSESASARAGIWKQLEKEEIALNSERGKANAIVEQMKNCYPNG